MQNPIETKRYISLCKDDLTVLITLKCGSSVMIDRDDFDRVVCRVLSLNWDLSGDGQGRHYVCVYHQRFGNIVPVARKIMRAGRGEVVRYRSRDRLDLRKSNLTRSEGAAKRSLRG